MKELLASSGERRTPAGASWTGDVHDVDRLHLDPHFDWLTAQVGHHALRYLAALGHDLGKTDLYVQRSWPVVARRSQRVARHAHHTAHLSAVYYVAAGDGEAAGQIRFLNDHGPNEVSAGIGSALTGGYSERNALNYGSALYRPIAGRLLLFPAKQTHEVEPNETDAERISISFDMVLTSRDAPGEGRHEFLMPPPSAWRQIGQRGSAASSLGPGPARPGRVALTRWSRHARDIDAFALPERAGHVLWDGAALARCSSAAAWDGLAATLAAVPEGEWRTDGEGPAQAWDGCGDWRVCRDAVDRLCLHLRHCDVPLDGANLGTPTLQRRPAGSDAPHRRGRAHLCAYLRLDRDAAADCALEFAEGGTVPLPPGTMLIVSGFRRHRLRGPSHVVHFDLDLPAIARPDALSLDALHNPEVQDAVLFAVATAQPIGHPLPPSDVLFRKLQWRDARAQRRARHETSPPVRRFLVERADPATATAEDLNAIRRHGVAIEGGAVPDGRLVGDIAVLTPAQCEALCRFADAHMTSVVPDTVDDLPEYQVDLSAEGLAGLVGSDAVAALLALPEALGAPPGAAAAGFYRQVDIFVRMYSPGTRPYIAFHSDTCSYTANVALNGGEGSFVGGELLAMSGGALRALPRRVGSAVLHAGDVVHGVTTIEAGARFTLILFFHRAADRAPSRPVPLEGLLA